MRRTPIAAALLLAAMPVLADQATAMRSGCLGCHKADARLVGPSFQEIAAKYQGDPAAVTRLAAKVKSGSQAAGEPLVWGQVHMPPSPAPVPDIEAVITWMMTHR